jgi:nitrogen fixation NifU-like protein
MNDSLYQQAIKKLAQSAHGAGRLTQPTVSIRLDNALCGDRIVLDLQIENGVITEVAHETKGCMLCTASASLLAREALGKSSADLGVALIELEALLGSNSTPSAHWSELSIFVPVRMHKSRYGCVLLPFRALCQAIGKVGL